MRKVLVLLITLSLVTVGSAAVYAGPEDKGKDAPDAVTDAPGSCKPNVALENDDVRIWFQGLKGHLKVFERDNGTDTTQVYDYQTQGLVELVDNETVAELDLGHAWPQNSGCTIEEDDRYVNITFVVTAEARIGGERIADPVPTVTFVFHWDKEASGAKFDVLADDWPWQSEESILAFDFALTSSYTIEPAENGVGFRDGTDSKGYIEWAPNATVTYADGHEETAIVDSTTDVSEGNHTANVRLAFTNVTAGYVHLDYDPWVGVGDYLIIAGLLVPLGALRTLVPAPARPVVDLLGDAL